MKFILIENATEGVTEKEVIRTVLSAPGSQGITVAQMRLTVKLLKKLEKVPDSPGGTLGLDDNEHELLQSRFETFRFGTVNEIIVTISDKIANASKKQPKPAGK